MSLLVTLSSSYENKDTLKGWYSDKTKLNSVLSDIMNLRKADITWMLVQSTFNLRIVEASDTK